MSKKMTLFILIACLALTLAGCGPAPDPGEDPEPAAVEESAGELIPTDTPLPPPDETEEDEAEEEEEEAGAARADMTLTSPAFAQDGAIPLQYSCDGDEISPELAWSGIPDGTASLALFLADPDAPGGTWDHWILFDIPADLAGLAQGGTAGTEGNNSWNQTGYGGPCPPGGTHRYSFKLYALDTTLDLPAGTAKGVLEAAMKGHILDQVELMGTYTR